MINSHFKQLDAVDKLIDAGMKLESLGSVVTWMAYSNDGEGLLEQLGESFGCVICDYAKIVHEIAEKLYHGRHKNFDFVTLLERANRMKQKLDTGEPFHSETKAEIGEIIAGVNDCLDKEIPELVAMKRYFSGKLEEAKSNEDEIPE